MTVESTSKHTAFAFRNNVLALLTDDEDEVDMRRLLEKKVSLDIIYNI